MDARKALIGRLKQEKEFAENQTAATFGDDEELQMWEQEIQLLACCIFSALKMNQTRAAYWLERFYPSIARPSSTAPPSRRREDTTRRLLDICADLNRRVDDLEADATRERLRKQRSTKHLPDLHDGQHQHD